MNVDTARAYCLGKPGVTEGMPFGEDVLVFKVGSKMFALLNLSRYPLSMGLKCDPEWAVELRERYEGVQPGYHMNKKHWNTVVLDGSVSSEEVRRMIDHSYDLVRSTLPRSERSALDAG